MPGESFQTGQSDPTRTLQDKLKTLAASTKQKLEDGLLGELEATYRREVPDIQPQLVSDSSGRVAHMGLVFNSFYGGLEGHNGEAFNRELLDAYAVLFTKMEPDTKFSIAVPDAEDRATIEALIEEKQVPNPERIQIVETRNASDIWTRDMGVVLEDLTNPGQSVFVENSRKRSSGITEDFADLNPELDHHSYKLINLAGGGIVSNDREAFVGEYSVSETSRQLNQLFFKAPELREHILEDPPEDGDYETQWAMYHVVSEQILEHSLGKPVTVLGRDDPTTPEVEEGEAAYHIDLCTTPVGDDRVFLGDPKLFRSIVESMSQEELDQATKVLSEATGKDWSTFERLVKNTEKLVVPEEFEAYRKVLEERDYEVESLPFWHASDSKTSDWPDELPPISFNNCIMEDFEKDGEQVKRVFLPITGIEKLDSYAIKAYQNDGYEVHPMKLLAVGQKLGAARCFSNVLARS